MARQRTYTKVLVARALMAQPYGYHYGREIARATGVLSGTLYPLLKIMAADGWLASEWERERPADRPRRRYYRLTDEGRRALSGLLAGAAVDPRFVVH